jgi:hypothetical protein
MKGHVVACETDCDSNHKSYEGGMYDIGEMGVDSAEKTTGGGLLVWLNKLGPFAK